jgi:hypothetical protein
VFGVVTKIYCCHFHKEIFPIYSCRLELEKWAIDGGSKRTVRI